MYSRKLLVSLIVLQMCVQHGLWTVNTRKLVLTLYHLSCTTHLELAHFFFEQCNIQLKLCYVTYTSDQLYHKHAFAVKAAVFIISP